mgnify:CR=1 FL=1|jgi:DNA adenine methylase
MESLAMTQPKIRHPVMRYHGGKFRLAPWIISHFPDHRCYVEPFGGAAGVLIQKPRSYAEVYNDLDGEVVNLFRVLRDADMCRRLQDACSLTAYAREEFNLAKQPATDPIERARRMVVRACMGFGSASALDSHSGFRCDSKRLYATAAHLWTRFPANLAAISERLQGVIIENKNALEVMRAHDGDDTLHYIDPPYVSETRAAGRRQYNHEMTDDDHVELLATATLMRGAVVISGYDCEIYRDLLTGWQMKTKSSRISAGKGTKTRQECIWLSPVISERMPVKHE